MEHLKTCIVKGSKSLPHTPMPLPDIVKNANIVVIDDDDPPEKEEPKLASPQDVITKTKIRPKARNGVNLANPIHLERKDEKSSTISGGGKKSNAEPAKTPSGSKTTSSEGWGKPRPKSGDSETSKPNTAGSKTASSEGWGENKPKSGDSETSKPSTSGWGSSKPSTGGWGSSKPSTGGWGSSKPSTGGWGSSTPSTGGWGSSKPSTGGWGSSKPSTGGWGSSKPNTGGWGSSKPSTGSQATGGWGKPQSGGTQISTSAGAGGASKSNNTQSTGGWGKPQSGGSSQNSTSAVAGAGGASKSNNGQSTVGGWGKPQEKLDASKRKSSENSHALNKVSLNDDASNAIDGLSDLPVTFWKRKTDDYSVGSSNKHHNDTRSHKKRSDRPTIDESNGHKKRQRVEDKAPSKVSNQRDSGFSGPSAGRGRGRGIHATKPAWMTKSSVNKQPAVQNSSSTVDAVGINSPNVISRGRGRGIQATKPAWMTRGSNDISNESASRTSNDQAGNNPPTNPARNEVQFNRPPAQHDSSNGFSSNSMGRGRGRGRTLPAWMSKNQSSNTSAPINQNATGTLPSKQEVTPSISHEVSRNASRGRGIHATKPAWMTQNSFSNAANSAPISSHEKTPTHQG